jgi:uncharacterized membrane protein YkoI
MRVQGAILILLATLLAAPLAPAQAEPPAREQRAPLTLKQAAERVRAQVGGQVLAADVVQHEDGTFYLIRVLVRRGQVKVFRVDPQTGRIY